MKKHLFISYTTRDGKITKSFLKEVFKDGVSLEDVGIDSKFALWLRMDELREIS